MKQLVLRPAHAQDFAFCRRLYCESKTEPRRRMDGDSEVSFAEQWRSAQVRLITMAGNNVGWLQTARTDDALDVGQIYVDRRFRRRGIGQDVMRAIIEEATRDHRAVTLGVGKDNPARRLYEGLGFGVAYEDQHELYLRREPGRALA